MGILAGIFKARDKPQNATSWSAYPFFLLVEVPVGRMLTCPRQHRHLKRKDSIRFLVLLVFSNFYIYMGCRKGTLSRQPHPRKDLFKSS